MYRTYHCERTCIALLLYRYVSAPFFIRRCPPPPGPLPPVASAEILRKPAVKEMAPLKANPVQSC
jgi:hypothetical protein